MDHGPIRSTGGNDYFAGVVQVGERSVEVVADIALEVAAQLGSSLRGASAELAEDTVAGSLSAAIGHNLFTLGGRQRLTLIGPPRRRDER